MCDFHFGLYYFYIIVPVKICARELHVNKMTSVFMFYTCLPPNGYLLLIEYRLPLE